MNEAKISLDGIHPDLINGLLEAKRNFLELKTCPFCGGEAFLFEESEYCIYVECEDCKIATPAYDSEAEAIDAWNTRVDVAKTNECCKKSCK